MANLSSKIGVGGGGGIMILGGQEGGYLEDIEGSWSETWRKGSSLKLWMISFYPKEDTLKMLCWYLN